MFRNKSRKGRVGFTVIQLYHIFSTVMSLCHHKEALNQVFLLQGAPMTRGIATGAQKYVPDCDDNGTCYYICNLILDNNHD